MNQNSDSILAVDASKRVALAIAETCPEAYFCLFTATDDGRKIPRSKVGPGVSIDTLKQDLYTAQEVSDHETLQPNNYWGLYMHEPVEDMFKSAVLTVLDVDMKRSTAATDMRIQRLAKWSKDNNHLAERSHSKKGRHVLFLSQPRDSVQPKYKLADHQEIEVFGQPHSPKKSLMLTGDMLTQSSISNDEVEIESLINELGLQPQPQTQHQEQPRLNIQTDDLGKAAAALNHISPDIDYHEWIQLGQALHDGFGDDALDVWAAWSQHGEKYKGSKDVESHWKSFNQSRGVGLGTLFHMAKQHGYTQPTATTERRTAVDDFMHRQATPTENRPAIETSWEELDYNLDHLPAVRYIIDGFLAHGLWVIAGQPGVGKTTVLMSLMLVITNAITDMAITSSRQRKIILVTEDADQIIRGLFGYAKHFRIDPALITKNVVIIRAKRSTLPEILLLEQNVIKHTMPDGTRPFLILDTANATLDLENENDNSEVGAYMSGLKQTIYTALDTPIGIVGHTNKQISRQDADAMARGASAFTGDATGMAVIFSDDAGSRYMRLVKKRYEPDFDELEFTTETFTALATSVEGEMVETICRVMTPAVSSAEQRERRAAEVSSERQGQRSQDRADEACIYVQSVINHSPNGLVMRRGKNPSRNPPSDMAGCARLDMADVLAAVPGSSRGDVRKAVIEAVFHRFAPTSSMNEWVRLS